MEYLYWTTVRMILGFSTSQSFRDLQEWGLENAVYTIITILYGCQTVIQEHRWRFFYFTRINLRNRKHMKITQVLFQIFKPLRYYGPSTIMIIMRSISHNATTSNNLEDIVFYYKKPVPDDFRFGSKDFEIS